METKITSAEICELASHYTYEQCKRNGLRDDEIEFEDEDGNLHYTDEVQDIFNRHYDLMCEILGHNK